MSFNLDSSVVRDINTRIVLSAVRRKTSTRTELAKITNLSYPTVGTIIKTLAADGFVADERLGDFGGGRKPMLVKFIPNARYIIGVNLGGAEPEAVLADLNGTFVSPIAVGRAADLEADVSGSVIKLIEDLRRTHPFSLERIIGIGISVRGSFDIPNRHYYYPGRTEPISLQDDLEDRFGVPVILERNASAAALAELVDGQAIGVRNILFVNVDQGVSSGLIVDGQLARGFLGNAGEFGHVLVDSNGKPCSDCGQKGCLETVVSIGGIVDEARRFGIELPALHSALDNYRVLVASARDGDEAACRCFQGVTEALGQAVTSLVNVINPQLIVIGGRVIWHYPELLETISDFVLSRCWPYSRKELRFAVATEDKHNFLHGAITLVLDKLFVPVGTGLVVDWSSHRDFIGGRGRLA